MTPRFTRTLHVVPAYGRDYKSRAEIQAAIDQGKDFVVADFSLPDDGRKVNAADARGAGYDSLQVRYSKMRKVCVIPIYPDTLTGALR